MQHEEYEEEEEEIDLESIEDEQVLIEMLDETEDIDERKRIRDRLRRVQFVIKAQREEQRKKREQEREDRIRNRVKEADIKKQQTLQMYNNMSAAKKQIDPSGEEKKRDLVEDAIQDRLRAADNRKKRIMAAFDDAATNQPAGNARIVEFDSFKSADVSKLEAPKVNKGGCTFGMSGGISKNEKPPVVSVKKASNPPDDSHLDPRERAIRARVREAEERKRRTLAAYDMAARTGGSGPKVFILEEFKDLEVNPEVKKAPKYDPCFRGGLKT